MKNKVFGFFGTAELITKIIINDETIEQVNQFAYLGCSISYQFSNDVESKMAKFLQLIGTIKRNIFRKVRKENIFENTQHFNCTYIFIRVRKLDSQLNRDEDLKRQK